MRITWIAAVVCTLAGCAPEITSRCEVDADCVAGVCVDGVCKVEGTPPPVLVNECTAGTDDCSPNATCTDTAAGFTCACNTNTGYVGDGKTCTLAPTTHLSVGNTFRGGAGYASAGGTGHQTYAGFLTGQFGTSASSLHSSVGVGSR